MRRQDGAAALTVLALTAAGLLALAVLLDIYAVYVTERAGRTAADAAAMGALKAAEEAFDTLARKRLQARLDVLEAEVTRAVSRRLDEWEGRRRAELQAQWRTVVPPLPDEQIDRLVAGGIARERRAEAQAIRGGVIRSRVRSGEVAAALTANRPVPFVAALDEFFTAVERGCLIRQVGTRHRPRLHAAAQWWARRNGGQEVVTLEFPHQQRIKVHVVVTVPVPLGVTARFAPTARPPLPAEATSRPADLGGLEFDLTGPC